MSNGWDHEAFKTYVLRAAANRGLDRQADISRATGISGSLLSKWFHGFERPSMASLHKLADGLVVPFRDLVILSGRASSDELDGSEVIEPPDDGLPPLARELARMLAEESPLSDDQRHTLTVVIDHAVGPYRPYMRRRRSA